MPLSYPNENVLYKGSHKVVIDPNHFSKYILINSECDVMDVQRSECYLDQQQNIWVIHTLAEREGNIPRLSWQ